MLARSIRLGRVLRRTARQQGRSTAAVLADVLRLWSRNGIRPRESLACGLADPAMTAEALGGCLGKPRLERLQRRLNPAGLECLLKDKSVFYPYCLGVGVPVPPLYAVFDVLGSWSCSGAGLSTDSDWERFLGEAAPEEFVLKPAWGIYGEGFEIFRRVAGGFCDTAGRTRPAAELVRLMREHRSYRRWVVQARLRNHPALERLGGTPFLQTLRLVTFVDDHGRARAFAPVLKLIGGSAVTDNFHGGREGNFVAAVRPADGTLHHGRTFDRSGAGMRILRDHPRTGLPLEGFPLPFWEQARRTAEAAARRFVPVRTIGWDIALTPDGPVIVEGNIWWDPLNVLAEAVAREGGEGNMPELLAILRAEARRPVRHGRGYRLDRVGPRVWR